MGLGCVPTSALPKEIAFVPGPFLATSGFFWHDRVSGLLRRENAGYCQKYCQLLLEGIITKEFPKKSLLAPLAQLDRASVYGTEGWPFESAGVYFTSPCETRACVVSCEIVHQVGKQISHDFT